MTTFAARFIFLIVCTVAGPVDAHEMILNDNDCRQDGIYGEFHCQARTHADESSVSVNDVPGQANPLPKLVQELPIKMNRSNTCVTPDSAIYNRQKKYRLYPSVEQCLREGGHLDGTVVLRQ